MCLRSTVIRGGAGSPLPAVVLLALMLHHPQVIAQGADVHFGTISGSVEQPRRHGRLRSPGRLEPAQAESIYRIVADTLARSYARSGHPVALSYRAWTRFNRVPYPSSAHGNHYLNNYANPVAAAYGRHEDAGTLPVGAVIAKDSFAVTGTGSILLGPLVAMVKMPPGFNYVSGDWKYIQVLPDGTVTGETRGPGAERVAYCIACHLARESTDHLYFVPPAARR